MHPGLAALAEALVGIGFMKRAGGEFFTIAFDDDALGWLSMMRSSRSGGPGDLYMDPVCGVRIQSLERCVAELRGDKQRHFLPPTVCRPLHYLTGRGQRSDWTLGRDTPEVNAEVIADSVACVEDNGLAYMRERDSLEAIY